MLSRRGLIAGVGGVAASTGAGRAQTAAPPFPVRPVRMIVGIPAGGAPDVIARILADRLAATWGQPVIVDNRPAASGNLAAQAVARGEPDGHTLFFAHASVLLLNEALTRDVPFNTERDFAPISLLMTTPFMLACRPGLPAAGLKRRLVVETAIWIVAVDLWVLVGASDGGFIFGTGLASLAYGLVQAFASRARVVAVERERGTRYLVAERPGLGLPRLTSA